MNLAELLNPQQLAAAEHKDGPLLILAGAGSGKTRAITYRIANLIANHGVNPGNIIAVTFTNKAAGEMNERVRKVAGENASKIWVSTFHSMGCRLMRAHAPLLGFTSNFSVYDEDDRQRLVKECMHEAKVSDKEMKPYEVIRRISNIKNGLLNPDEYDKEAHEYFSKLTARIYRIYERKIKANNAVDFDDLIKKPVELFRERPEILELYREKFKYVLIDEYQDINNSQYELVMQIAKKYRNICVVGDDDQSIYRFRGADITNILGFEEDFPEAKVVRLEQNYRSTKTVLRAAHAVIKNNKDRKEKELWTDNNDGEKIVFYYTDDEVHESEMILTEADKALREHGTMLRDIAVFYRTNAQSRVIEDRFRRAGLPYKLVGGIQFYGRLEIKDLLAYLRVVANPKDIISFKRIVNVPSRGIGDAAIDKIEQFTFTHSIDFIEGLNRVDEIEGLKENTKAACKGFYAMMKDLADNKDNMTLQDIIKTVIAESGYIDYWENDNSPKSSDRIENVREMVSAMAEFEENNKGAKLSDFLNQVALVSDSDKLDEKANAVTLMTIHSAKGLEYDMVFLAGMDEGVFPHKNCFEEEDGIEEERRLAYVGITRARKKLFLMSAVSRRQYGTKKIGSVSRFIDEIPAELITRKGRAPVKALDEKYLDGLSGFTKDDVTDSAPAFEYTDSIEGAAPLKMGDNVKHKVMGKGKVMNVEPNGEDYKVTVMFKAKGKKILSLKFAGLEKV